MTETRTPQVAPPVDGGPPAPGVSVVEVRSEREARAAVAVLSEVWRREDGQPPLPPELAWAFAHSGNYVALALAGDRPVAAAIGLRGAARPRPGPPPGRSRRRSASAATTATAPICTATSPGCSRSGRAAASATSSRST